MGRQRVSLVDLGSNSARLVVFEFERGRGFRLIDEIREVIRLGEGVVRTGRLTAPAIERAVVALRAFGDYCQATGLPPVRIMATSAVRSAKNRGCFLARVQELGLEIEVLDGGTEAAQGVLAVANSGTLEDAWVVDLGGGSLQLARMADRRYRSGKAYPLGAISATEEFLEHDPPRPDEIVALEAAVDARLGTRLEEMADSGLPLVAMGGTVRNLARAVQKRSDYPWPAMHGYFLPREGLGTLTEALARRTSARRAKVTGISSHRADIIVAGAVVFRRILHRAGLDGIHISGYGMREGALFQEYLPAPHLLEDVRDAAVRNLMWRFPQPTAHNDRVVRLSRRLFDELQPLHGFGEAEAGLLQAAARLHDIGKAIRFRDHARHGEYLVAGDPMPGFDHRQHALLSLLLRYHSSGRPSRAPYRSLLDRQDREILVRLTVCLRLAEYLERSRTGRVRDVRVRIDDGTVVLELIADGEPWVEYWETQKQAPLFESAFKQHLALKIV